MAGGACHTRGPALRWHVSSAACNGATRGLQGGLLDFGYTPSTGERSGGTGLPEIVEIGYWRGFPGDILMPYGRQTSKLHAVLWAIRLENALIYPSTPRTGKMPRVVERALRTDVMPHACGREPTGKVALRGRAL